MSVVRVVILLSWGIGVVAATHSPTFSRTPPDPNRCDGPYKHEHGLHVYHIISDKSARGLSNKNAATSMGTMAFIFGAKGVPMPRGLIIYYPVHGLLEMKFLSVKEYGDYLQCTHGNSSKYVCKCPADHHGACNMEKPGKERNDHSNGHLWYSFPEKGHGKYWDYEYWSATRGCKTIVASARCVIDKLTAAAHCSDSCKECASRASTSADCREHLSASHCPHHCSYCGACMEKFFTDHDKTAHHVWDEAVWSGECAHSEHSSQADKELLYPAEIVNTSAVFVV